MEETYFILKPSFVNRETVNLLISKITENNLEIKEEKLVKYTKDCALKHYKEKRKCDFYDELCAYLSSDYSYCIIAKGNNAISLGLKIKKEIREMFLKNNQKTMKNVIHSSDSIINAQKEIEIFKTM